MFAYQRANQEALFYWYAMFYYNEDKKINQAHLVFIKLQN